MSYLNLEKLNVEIAWDFDSTVHYDDQMAVYAKQGNFITILIADGVSMSKCGRLAATLMIHYFIKFLESNEYLFTDNLSSVIEKIIEKGITFSVDRMRNDVQRLENYFIIKILENDHKTLVQENKKNNKLYNKLLSVLNQDNLKNLEDKLINETSLIVNSLKNRIEELSSLHLHPLYTNLYLEPTVSSLNELLHTYDELRNLIIKQKELTALINNITLPELKTPQEILQEIDIKQSFSELMALWDQVKRVLTNLANKKRENIKKLFEYVETSFFKDIMRQNPSETTFSLVTLFNHNGSLWGYFYILGDTQLASYNIETGEFKILFQTNTSKLTNYISSKDGVHGMPQKIFMKLNENEIYFVFTDGANYQYTTPGGVPGWPFINQLRKHLDSEGSLNGFPEEWIDFIKSQDAQTDDASIVAFRVLAEEN